MIEQNIHVLLVEDDHRLALLTKEYLETHGITVVHVAKGEAALEVLSQNHFTAIILDIMLPDMGGYEVCRRIRTFSDVPILILSTAASTFDIRNRIYRYIVRGLWSNSLTTHTPFRSNSPKRHGI